MTNVTARTKNSQRPPLIKHIPKLIALVTGLSCVQTAHAAEPCQLASYGTLPVDMINGHPTTTVTINGRSTRLIVDTGAFYNFMAESNVKSLGLPLEASPPGLYASFMGRTAGVQLTHVKEMGMLNSILHDVTFIVGGTDNNMGSLGANLLNMNDLEVDLAQGKMAMMRPKGCLRTPLAYWAKDGVFEMAALIPQEGPLQTSPRLTVLINGKPVKAKLSTDGGTFIIRAAAERAGIDLASAKERNPVEPFGAVSRAVKSWTARVTSYQIGTETIQNSSLVVIDSTFSQDPPGYEMVLGRDFFLAHHVFIAKSQNKLYFTYNGGRVSYLDKTIPVSTRPMPAQEVQDEPTSARDYGLRGEARLARGETVKGLADLDKAIDMAPDDKDSATYYLARAKVRAGSQSATGATDNAHNLAMRDLDMALRLEPDNLQALLWRARMLIERDDLTRADMDISAARRIMPAGALEAMDLGNLMTYAGRPEDGVPILDAWIALHPGDGNLAVALNNRCWALALANKMLDSAEQDCRKAIKRDGNDPNYTDSLAMVELRQGHYQSALDLYDKVLNKAPHKAWSRYGRALALLHLSQTEAGKAELAAVTLANPQIVARAQKLGLTPP